MTLQESSFGNLGYFGYTKKSQKKIFQNECIQPKPRPDLRTFLFFFFRAGVGRSAIDVSFIDLSANAGPATILKSKSELKNYFEVKPEDTLYYG